MELVGLLRNAQDCRMTETTGLGARLLWAVAPDGRGPWGDPSHSGRRRLSPCLASAARHRHPVLRRAGVRILRSFAPLDSRGGCLHVSTARFQVRWLWGTHNGFMLGELGFLCFAQDFGARLMRRASASTSTPPRHSARLRLIDRMTVGREFVADRGLAHS